MVLAALSPLCLTARGIADVIEGLEGAPACTSDVKYTVTLPSRDDDVVYTLRLHSTPTPADTLSPCAYLIEWSLDTPTGPATGWTSYFDGNLYSFRDHRLREYHTAWDPAPFSPKGAARRLPGVQESAQFVTLLPPCIARELRAMQADTLYTVSAPRPASCDGRDALRVDAVMDVAGERVQERSYWLDASTLLPLRIDMESNPASITEQTITVRYTPADTPTATPMSEDALLALYPEAFEKYRESNFRIENMADTPLPTFSLPSATGERYTHHRGDRFRAPTVVVLLDPATSFSADVVKAVRQAIEMSTVPADVIWAVTGTDADAAEGLVPAPLREGEHLLLNARSLARDCGAASLPVTIVADAGAVAKKIVLGFNPELSTIVLQSIALMN